MPVPNNVARLYVVDVQFKGDPPGRRTWAGRATNVTDAFDQARRWYDSKKDWKMFRCQVISVRD